jgi:hypothetical protein
MSQYQVLRLFWKSDGELPGCISTIEPPSKIGDEVVYKLGFLFCDLRSFCVVWLV